MKLLCLLILLFFTSFCMAQSSQSIGIGTNNPSASAKLDVSSTNAGLLIPRMTSAQRAAIASPAVGLLVFDTDKSTILFFDGSGWQAMAFADENKFAPISRTPTNPTPFGAFGTRVAISGNYAIIGAPRVAYNQLNTAGGAYIFVKESGAWKQLKQLNAWDAQAGDYFGGSVAISGDYAAVGSCAKKIGNNFYQGKVYMYRRNGTDWIPDSSLTRNSPAANDYFGYGLGLSSTATGDPKLMIGTPYADAGGTDRGEVSCYTRGTNGWTFIQNIIPTDLTPSDYFGQNISMHGDYAVVGAPSQDYTPASYANAGAVYVFVFGGGVWNQQQKFQGTVANGQFGAASAIYADRIAVGAPWATTYTNTSSSVYIYKRTGATWALTSTFFVYNFEIIPGASQINSNSTTTNKQLSIANITFGMSLAMDGPNLLVGSSGGIDYPNGGSSYYSDHMGAVYHYKILSGDFYTRMQVIKSDYPALGDLFGQSVAISGDKFIIGNARASSPNASSSGGVLFGSVAN